MGARFWRDVSDAAGLTQFGAVLYRIAPGGTSSLRHWHENEDEFVMVLSGELVLRQDGGETPMRAGDCAGFRAGDPDGHCFENRGAADATFLAVGTRAARDACRYSDVDLVCESRDGASRFLRRDGTPVG
jgi:uncharacterized cupin superfamily protein